MLRINVKCEDLFKSMLQIGILSIIRPNHNPSNFPMYISKVLLYPEYPDAAHQAVTLKVPTHWDVQEAITGLEAIRPPNTEWLELTFHSQDDGPYFEISTNHALSYFMQQAPEQQMAKHEILTWYAKLRQRILRYVYMPGIPSEYRDHQDFFIATHPEALAPVPARIIRNLSLSPLNEF